MEKRVENREVQSFRERKRKRKSAYFTDFPGKAMSIWCVFFNFVQSRNFFPRLQSTSPILTNALYQNES